MTLKTRQYHSANCRELAELFRETVHAVNVRDYSEAQLNAWAPENRDLLEWNDRLSGNHSIVAENDGVIVGFGTLDQTGYFDLLYVHKNYQRMGIATAIADEIETYAHTQDIRAITVDASITAKPFFEKRDYRLVKPQTVTLRGRRFLNFKMQKTLY